MCPILICAKLLINMSDFFEKTVNPAVKVIMLCVGYYVSGE